MLVYHFNKKIHKVVYRAKQTNGSKCFKIMGILQGKPPPIQSPGVACHSYFLACQPAPPSSPLIAFISAISTSATSSSASPLPCLPHFLFLLMLPFEKDWVGEGQKRKRIEEKEESTAPQKTLLRNALCILLLLSFHLAVGERRGGKGETRSQWCWH